MARKTYTVIGMMSGTSLDGMDLVLCRFKRGPGEWHYEILKAETYNYPVEWTKRLRTAPALYASDFMMLHNDYGRYIGRMINDFMIGRSERVDLVSSHGHTIFHQPNRRFTFQLGSGSHIASESGIPTVSDFRTMDVALGGQGAPLVPAGDKLLFSQYGYCLNLGGFANISNDYNGVRIACDICPVNIVANQLSTRLGMEFDRDGLTGRKGSLLPELLNEMNSLEFYTQTGPKSLGREWVETVFMPLISKNKASTEDLLCTLYEHIAIQISNYINSYESGAVLVTGGGAFNTYLVELIREKTDSNIVIPDEKLVKFKEAVVFAFLGLLRKRNEINCYSSVTGASSDSCTGMISAVISD